MLSTTCKLKWVNEFQHEFLSHLIICFTLGITLGELMARSAAHPGRQGLAGYRQIGNHRYYSNV